MIPMFVPYMSEDAIENASTALRQRMIGEGETVKEFETALREKFGFQHALLLNNGTAGLRLALAVAGVGPGDEVITTAMTCTATNTPILEQYAKPVFADIQYNTGNINPYDIEHRITGKTKAIICVHWGGYPCDLEEITELAMAYGLPVIQDAAHALGATYHGQPISAISRFAMFSFQAIKTLTTVDGGILAMTEEDDYWDAKVRRWFGIDRDRRRPSEEWPGYYVWPQTVLGYKYQPTNVQAAIGLGNLLHFDGVFKRRQILAKFYRRGLRDVPGLGLFDNKDDRRCAHWLFTVHVEDRQNFHRMMKENGIETSVCHIRNDLHPIFGEKREDLPILDSFQDTYICLPMHQAVTGEDAVHIVNTIKKGW